jgi:four helix bundle protein
MVRKKNEILELSFEFSLAIIDTYKYLRTKKEYVMSKQLLRSGTSIGANVTEAQAAQSVNDFIAKMSIASKEARETEYWLRLLVKSGYLSKYNRKSVLIDNIQSIIKLLTSIVKTTQGKNK